MFDNTKLILCDLDGSLLDSNKRIDSDIIDVIEKLKTKGIKFSIVSGRNNFAIKEIVDELNIDYPYICNNGAIIYKNDRAIHINAIKNDDLREIIDLLYEYNMDFVFDTKDKVICHRLNTNNNELTVYINRLAKHFDFVFDFNRQELYDLEPLKITLIDDDINRIKEIQAIINQKYTNTKCNQSEDSIFVISDINNNKGQGISWLAQYLNISLKDIMVFGDNYNDKTMLEKAGYGILMQNANEDLKVTAKYITKYDNNHHGISRFIKENLL